MKKIIRVHSTGSISFTNANYLDFKKITLYKKDLHYFFKKKKKITNLTNSTYKKQYL